MSLTIPEFIATLPRPRSIKTVRRWISLGQVYPPPEKFGREYIFEDNAVYTGNKNNSTYSTSGNNPLIKRIKNGRTEKNR